MGSGKFFELSFWTTQLSLIDVTLGETHASLLATQLIVTHGYSDLLLEGDTLTLVTAINNPLLFKDYNFSSAVDDIFLLSKVEKF
jgi:hypothetical protein